MVRKSDHDRIDDLTLGTINTSLRTPVSGDELVRWLHDKSTPTDGRETFALTAFFTEVPLETQVRFLLAHHIDEDSALDVASRLDIRTDVPLRRRQQW